MTPEERAAFRAFVREHHPDRGGDPEAFVTGLAALRAGDAGTGPSPARPHGPPPDVEFVRDLPLPTKVAVALIRTVRRHRRTRVDRADRPSTAGQTIHRSDP
ncbi:hypothetical protein [Pseudonocardia dioxanivorans]|uniref:Uncharacterized protein n=1 Tax=Pseudonocardia dioxanivorans (strain ATCC 55486 / DSM 44775 / JCM 13855 / CB1190) TaxID=675635 RepID=F4CPJ1_PSEUX|nr:hypothetical protein [Pseudonocardia dioxanivorans]AEA25108.1 hypothetical protein Psed_2908 [Pseudonocardia dioxanivorans CB1190]